MLFPRSSTSVRHRHVRAATRPSVFVVPSSFFSPSILPSFSLSPPVDIPPSPGVSRSAASIGLIFLAEPQSQRSVVSIPNVLFFHDRGAQKDATASGRRRRPLHVHPRLLSRRRVDDGSGTTRIGRSLTETEPRNGLKGLVGEGIGGGIRGGPLISRQTGGRSGTGGQCGTASNTGRVGGGATAEGEGAGEADGWRGRRERARGGGGITGTTGEIEGTGTGVPGDGGRGG